MEAKPAEEQISYDQDTGEALDVPIYYTGWRLHGISAWLLLSLFVAQMDTSITSTAILTITDQLGGFEKYSWVFTAYMLSFCGFQLVWAKLSDIISRKTAIIISLSMFTLFSGACAASRTLIQLIMFRWIQRIGGGGIFALTQLVFFELVPPIRWPLYVSLVTGVVALSLAVGPLIGGAIALRGQWKWIFLLNVPTCGTALIGLFVIFPAKLRNEPSAQDDSGSFTIKSLRRIDVLGSLLLLGACLLISTGLQQAALGYAWQSSLVLPLLLITVPLVVAFFIWEWYITSRRGYPEPVFPWRFCQSRIRIGMMLNTYLWGTVLMICLIQIPQRFMTVYGLSPFNAALRLLTFGAFVPAGSSIAAALMGKLKIPPCFIILAGAALQLVGAILLSDIPTDTVIHPRQYGFQILLGTGIGFVACGLILLVPFAMEKRDLAVGTASISQFRVLGGLISIGIATSLSTPYLRTHLTDVLPPELAYSVLEKTENMYSLPIEVREGVKAVFGKSFNLQIKMVIGFSAAQFPATWLMWTGQTVNPVG
ncbi:MFS general substrate transporter [Trematosphaeria pertusa]|uniref:MFS general substrate transporter n=1 Tax=Trematosphaeria pertusa TaxID=390896 RepID=A0A6A6J259_9PLEO|nr:MFS general substrate transporter [Trematosphaeria pertusa]KAF2256481.1 MFS general substrate transporter [Trematosphaeria pertusa]